MELIVIPITFIFIIIKYNINVLAKILLSFYSLGAMFGILLTKHPLFPYMQNVGYQDMSIGASVYLLFTFLILFYPVITSKNISLCGGICKQRFERLSYILIGISALYILYIFPHIFDAFNAIDFAEYKEDIMEAGGFDASDGNSVLEKIFSFQVMLRPFIMFFFCYAIAKLNHQKKFIMLLGLAALLPSLLHTMAAAHRNIIVFSLIDFFLCFIIFYKEYTEKQRKRFFILFSLVAAIVGFVVVYFALLRFSKSSSGLDEYVEYSLYRYLGEPMVDFNTMIWGTDKLLYGNKCFPVIREYMGLSFQNPATIRDDLANLPYIIYFFYTIVGNFYMDFGAIGTILLLVIIACFFYWLLKIKLKYNTITRLLILFMYTSTTIQNYFYFAYMGYNNILFVWQAIFIWIVYRYIDNHKVRLSK